MDPEVGAVHGEERLAELAQGGLAAGPDLLLGQREPQRPSIAVEHLAVADLVLQPADPVYSEGVVADAQLRLLGHLGLGDQVALGRIPAGELDARCLADDASPSVAPDEILRAQRLAIRQLDVDAGVVLRVARHLAAVVHQHRQFGDPCRHDPLDLVLPDPKRIRMARRKVAHVQHGRADRGGLSDLTRARNRSATPRWSSTSIVRA